MAKLVDAWDLKSPVRKDVPVRFRLRAPNKSGACMRFFMQALCFCSATLKAVPQFFIFAPPLAYCQSTKIQDIPATAKPLAPHARNGIANPLNMAAISGARCNRIAIGTHRCVRESRKSHAGYFPSLGVLPNHQTNPIEYDFVLCTWSHPRLGTHSLPRYAGRIL